MKDLHESSRVPGAPDHHRQRLRNIPTEAWDLVTGASAGAAAVLVSMPFDCVKTYMQTHGTDLGGKGVLGSARLFFKTGSGMVKAGGIGSLYYGLAPRLLQQVPSSMICWYTIHSVQRLLLPPKDHLLFDHGGPEGDSLRGPGCAP